MSLDWMDILIIACAVIVAFFIRPPRRDTQTTGKTYSGNTTSANLMSLNAERSVKSVASERRTKDSNFMSAWRNKTQSDGFHGRPFHHPGLKCRVKFSAALLNFMALWAGSNRTSLSRGAANLHGCSAAWLARPAWDRKVEGSNPSIRTTNLPPDKSGQQSGSMPRDSHRYGSTSKPPPVNAARNTTSIPAMKGL